VGGGGRQAGSILARVSRRPLLPGELTRTKNQLGGAPTARAKAGPGGASVASGASWQVAGRLPCDHPAVMQGKGAPPSRKPGMATGVSVIRGQGRGWEQMGEQPGRQVGRQTARDGQEDSRAVGCSELSKRNVGN